MKYVRYALLVLVIAWLGFAHNARQTTDQREPTASLPVSLERSWETQTDEQAGVVVRVTPLELGEGSTWRFRIIFDTHAGSLNDDLLAVASLTDEKGNVHRPIAWEGSEPGGHHREGVLTFGNITPLPSRVVLAVRGVGGAEERRFEWNRER